MTPCVLGRPFSKKNFFILTTCKSGKVSSVQFKRTGHSIRGKAKKGECLLLKRKINANGSKSMFVFFVFLFDIYARLTRFLILVAVVKISLKKHAPLHLFWYFISLREVAFKLYPYLVAVKKRFCEKPKSTKNSLCIMFHSCF
jgi:histone deacetylase complex regulatory component SIN3